MELVSKTNIFPGRTPFALQARSYALKFSGNAFLNCRALELQGNSFTHVANAIHGIDQRFCVGFDDITTRNLYHGGTSFHQ